MTIASYSDLQSSTAGWLNRQDLTAVIPDFITLAHAKFNRELRFRDMMVRAQAFTNAEFVPVPDDFLENYTLELVTTTPTPPFVFVSPDEAKRIKAAGYTGKTRYYTAMDSFFELIPAPQTSDSLDLVMVYYAKIPALSVTNASNWLLNRSPDLYLYSTLLEAAPYLKDDERLGLWAGARQKVITDMQMEDERAMRPTMQLTARRRTFG